MNEEILIAAIIKQAIEDYIKYQRNPQKYSKSGRGTTTKFKHFQSASIFLFRKGRLEEFFTDLHIPLNANFIRRMVHRIVKNRMWDWYLQDIYHPERRENVTDRQQLFSSVD